MLAGDQPGGPERRGSGMLVEDALDDVLWNNPPIANYATHYPVRDIELDGVVLKAETPVLISFAAANSDPSLTDARQTLSKGPIWPGARARTSAPPSRPPPSSR